MGKVEIEHAFEERLVVPISATGPRESLTVIQDLDGNLAITMRARAWNGHEWGEVATVKIEIPGLTPEEKTKGVVFGPVGSVGIFFARIARRLGTLAWTRND